VLDRHMPAERRHVAENRVVANMTVVRDVDVGHEHVAIADFRDAAAAARAAVNRDELAKDIALANHELGTLAAEFQVLRNEADRGERMNLGALADFGPAVDDGGGANSTVRVDADMRTDHRMGTDP